MRNTSPPPPLFRFVRHYAWRLPILCCLLFPLFSVAQTPDECDEWKIEISATPAANITGQLGSGPGGCVDGGACDDLYYYVSLIHVGTENDTTPYYIQFLTLGFNGSLSVTPGSGTAKTFSYPDSAASIACSPAGINDPNNSDAPVASWDTDGGLFAYSYSSASPVTWTVHGRKLLFVVAVHTYPGEAILPASMSTTLNLQTNTGPKACNSTPVTSGTLEKTLPSLSNCGTGVLTLSLGSPAPVTVDGYPNAMRIPVYARSGSGVSVSELEFLLNIVSSGSAALIDTATGVLPLSSITRYVEPGPGASTNNQRIFCSGKSFSVPSGNTNIVLFYVIVNGPVLASDCEKVIVSFDGERRLKTSGSCCRPTLGNDEQEIDFGEAPCMPHYCSTNAELKIKKTDQASTSCTDLYFTLSLANNATSGSLSYTSGEVTLRLRHEGSLSYSSYTAVDVAFNTSGTYVTTAAVNSNLLELVFHFTGASNIVVGHGTEKILAAFLLQGMDACVESITFYDASLHETGASQDCIPVKISSEIDATHQLCLQDFSVLFEKQYVSDTSVVTGIDGVDYMVMADNSNCEEKGTSNDHGFDTRCLCPEKEQTLTPIKDNNPLNGVSTYDLVLISRHILTIDTFSNPYKRIAADANKNGFITSFDIVELRKLILGIYQTLPNNTSWRFIPESYVFPNPANPFQPVFPEKLVFELPIAPPGLIKFYGIKIGDVNGSVIPSVIATSAEDRGANLPLAYHLPPGKRGDLTDIPLFVPQPTDLVAWQLALHFDSTSFRIKDVRWAMSPELTLYEMADWAVPTPGELRLNWFDRRGETAHLAAGAPIAYLRVERLRNQPAEAPSALQIAGTIPSESYDAAGRPASCTLQAASHFEAPAIPAKITPPAKPAWTVLAYPNPTDGQFRFEVDLPVDGAGSIALYDPLSRLVTRLDYPFKAGGNVITSRELPTLPPGLYFLQVDTPLGRQVVRLVRR